MAKVLFVKEAPETLEKGDYVVQAPNFLSEIALHRAKAPRNGVTGIHHLRVIADSIAQKYDPEQMSAYSIKPHLYEGRPFSSDEELNGIVVEMLKACYPRVFAQYIDYHVKNRPADSKRLIFVESDLANSLILAICIRNGLDVSSDKEQTQVAEKPKKVVGKPAVTKEQAEQLKQQQDQ